MERYNQQMYIAKPYIILIVILNISQAIIANCEYRTYFELVITGHKLTVKSVSLYSVLLNKFTLEATFIAIE